MIHLDTTFLVDLLREARRRERGAATKKLESLGDEELGISLFVLCELEAGAALAARADEERDRVRAVVSRLALVLPDATLAGRYGELLAALRSRGEAIATMDLLIASAALADAAPLVTRNVRHFDRVPGLEVLGY